MLADIKGPSIVCDCDHSLNVDEIFKNALKNKHDCIIPTWEITKDEWMNWSKVVLDKNSNIKMICECFYGFYIRIKLPRVTFSFK